MRSQRGQNRLQPVAIVLPRNARQLTRARMQPALVGRHRNHAASLPKLRQALHQQIVQLPRRQIGFNAARRAIETHALISSVLMRAFP